MHVRFFLLISFFVLVLSPPLLKKKISRSFFLKLPLSFCIVAKNGYIINKNGRNSLFNNSCTRHRTSFRIVDLKICAHTLHSVSVISKVRTWCTCNKKKFLFEIWKLGQILHIYPKGVYHRQKGIHWVRHFLKICEFIYSQNNFLLPHFGFALSWTAWF